MNAITFNTNNDRKLVFTQHGEDDTIFVAHLDNNGNVEDSTAIEPGDFIMLYNLYRHIIDNDIQNDFINYYGKNKEEG